jgi:cytochrome b
VVNLLLVILIVVAVYAVNILTVIKKQHYVLIEMIRKQNDWDENTMDEISDNALFKKNTSEPQSTQD